MDRPKIVRKVETLEQLLVIVKQGMCGDAQGRNLHVDCQQVDCDRCILSGDDTTDKGIDWIKDTLL